jgi:hypothetical protein
MSPKLVRWRHALTDERTRDMLVELAKSVTPYVRPTQGGFSNSVAASAGTHGRAAIDISVSGLSKSRKLEIVRQGRIVGFAMWLRLESEGPWVEHIHGVPVDGDLSAEARSQVEKYRKCTNGL